MRLVVFPVLLCAAAVAAHAGGIAPNLTRNGRSAHINYMTECQGCHLPDGSGQKGSVPSMKAELHRFLKVEGGREFLVQVPGSANSKLSDADLAALLNWLLPKMGGIAADGFKPYTPEEVATYRSQRLVDVTGTRAALVAKFDQPETSSVN
ncbi:c-type cytochrome [Sphingosinicella xenopeptidilytica]|uniref:C-type cytochrome n=1 Tax=Sphingosinicella xenopeptidilytica TaxID=364098 RepID=A0ABW3C5K6_SPHXN